jgi:hypothetical protein
LADIEAAFGRDASVVTSEQALGKLKNWNRESDEATRTKLRAAVLPQWEM